MMMPGPIESLFVLVFGLLTYGVPVAILVVVIIILPRQQRENDVSRLIEENQALRQELEELKSRQGNTRPES